MLCVEHNYIGYGRESERPAAANHKHSYRIVERPVLGVEGQAESLAEPVSIAGKPHKHHQAADSAADDAATLIPGVGAVAADDVFARAGAGGGDESPDQRGLLGGEAGRSREDDLPDAGQERVQLVSQVAGQGPTAEAKRLGTTDPATGAQTALARGRAREALRATKHITGRAERFPLRLPSIYAVASALQRSERLPVAPVAPRAAGEQDSGSRAPEVHVGHPAPGERGEHLEHPKRSERRHLAREHPCRPCRSDRLEITVQHTNPARTTRAAERPTGRPRRAADEGEDPVDRQLVLGRRGERRGLAEREGGREGASSGGEVNFTLTAKDSAKIQSKSLPAFSRASRASGAVGEPTFGCSGRSALYTFLSITSRASAFFGSGTSGLVTTWSTILLSMTSRALMSAPVLSLRSFPGYSGYSGCFCCSCGSCGSSGLRTRSTSSSPDPDWAASCSICCR